MWLTLKEACEYARVSERTIRRWAREGKIIAVRPAGGKVFIQKESIDEFYLGCQEEELFNKVKSSFDRCVR